MKLPDGADYFFSPEYDAECDRINEDFKKRVREYYKRFNEWQTRGLK